MAKNNKKDVDDSVNEIKIDEATETNNLEEVIKEETPEKDKLTKLKEDFDDLNEKYIRCLAEYDNFRKRSAKEKERIFSDAISYSVKGILDVLDNFERALLCETQDAELKKGFELIFVQLTDCMKKLGVEQIKTEGVDFDPLKHNAVMHVEDDNYGENEIIETLQKGYKLNDNIIRYAMVKVAN